MSFWPEGPLFYLNIGALLVRRAAGPTDGQILVCRNYSREAVASTYLLYESFSSFEVARWIFWSPKLWGEASRRWNFDISDFQKMSFFEEFFRNFRPKILVKTRPELHARLIFWGRYMDHSMSLHVLGGSKILLAIHIGQFLEIFQFQVSKNTN